ncbi:MAG TPA: aconitate hydratase [Candidatus Lokiarchaeia archaeon]|nr:aconitate hydratase [Candidatus Lokiarchaeia archaeon]
MSNARTILENHLVDGTLEKGHEISIRIDNTLTQDATGTLAYLQFEALGMSRVKTEKSVSFVDHNMLQTDFKNPDDHRFLQSVAAKYGIYFSRAGNGICHQVFLERFSKPGNTLLGSDSHTPTAGGAGMLAIGAGGIDVAIAMAGEPFQLKMPEIVGIKLVGQLQPFVSGKDIILELLRRITVKGGFERIFEYFGSGVLTLSVPERATITNMGAETGATTSLFPSDEMTKAYFDLQERPGDWMPMPTPEDEIDFDDVIEIDLDALEPLVAKPHSPDNVVPVSDVEGTPLDQVAIGSCTNSSVKDLMAVASILNNKRIAPNISLGISPGSREVIEQISKNGTLTSLVRSGARILESACGPCIGMGFSPPSAGASLRTFNRNFQGRSGTVDAEVFLASPEVAAASALAGSIADPRKLEGIEFMPLPDSYEIDDGMIIPPIEDGTDIKVIYGPNIKPVPLAPPMSDSLRIKVLIKVGDNITTDSIMPAGAEILPLRSNIPEIAKHVFERVDKTFAERALSEQDGSVVVGGLNYGQGSAREHAAIAPMYLGVKAVLAKSFARIHEANLINFGIIPFEFADPDQSDAIDAGDELEFPGLRAYFEEGAQEQYVINDLTKDMTIPVNHHLSPRSIQLLLAGGLLNYIKDRAQNN